MRNAEHCLRAQDGTSLFARSYEPENWRDGRTLVLVHGTSEHGGRYQHVIPHFLARGWRLILPDQRGHGRSGGVPTHVHRFEEYLADLDTFRAYFDWNPSTTGMVGHSMGGLVTARYLQTRPDAAAGVALLSPLFGLMVQVPWWTLLAGQLVAGLAPRTRFRSRVRPEDTTSNPQALAARFDDPLIHRSVTAGWFSAMKKEVSRVWRNAKKFETPVLVIQAGNDRIVDPLAPAYWLETIASPDRTLHVISDALHELLNEPQWQETASEISHWMMQRTTGLHGVQARSA